MSGPRGDKGRRGGRGDGFALMAPWQDSRGRLAPLKAIAFAALFVPAAWLLYGYLARTLGPRPLTEIIHASGDWAIRLLFVALAITPLRQILGWPGLIALRRMAGVAALAYAGLHLSVYVADVSFDLGKAAREIWLRSYLTIGFVALLALIPLGVTSTDAMIRRLGGKRWRRLHRASYAIAVLAVVHFFWQSKLDIREPVIMAGIFLWLMAFRLLPTAARRGGAMLAAMAGLAVLAAALAALIEALYYNLRVGAPLARVLEANLGFANGASAAAIVLAATLGAVAAGAARAAFLAIARRPGTGARALAARA